MSKRERSEASVYRRGPNGRLERIEKKAKTEAICFDIVEALQIDCFQMAVLPFLDLADLMCLFLCLFFTVKGFNLCPLFEAWFVSTNTLPMVFQIKPVEAHKFVFAFLGKAVIPLYKNTPSWFDRRDTSNVNVCDLQLLPCAECLCTDADFIRSDLHARASFHLCMGCAMTFYPFSLTSLYELWQYFPFNIQYHKFKERVKEHFKTVHMRKLWIAWNWNTCNEMITTEDAWLLWTSLAAHNREEVSRFIAEWESEGQTKNRENYIRKLQEAEGKCNEMYTKQWEKFMSDSRGKIVRRLSPFIGCTMDT